MIFPRFGACLLTLCIILLRSDAQLITESFVPQITGTTTLTAPLESLYSAWTQPVDTETFTATVDGAVQTATYTYNYYGGLQQTDVAVATGYTISNFSAQGYAYCWYQTSGNWALLPRILFYFTIVAALILRKHDWLVAGALAASLTFSGVAAVQISVQVWTRQAAADLDLYPILGILSTSCIVAIPLMNWSETIRYLGLTEAEKREKRRIRAKEDKRRSQYIEGTVPDEKITAQMQRDPGAPTLTIIVFWALLVAIGFLSALAGFISMRNSDIGAISLFTYSGADTVHCVPDNGILDLSAGQFSGWIDFWLNDEFVSKNNCENPCTKLPDGLYNIFRSNQDLAVLTARQVDTLFEKSNISDRETRALNFTAGYFRVTIFGLAFIVVQGFGHFIYFGRHSPREARTNLYRTIVRAHDRGFVASTLRKRIAMILTMIPYTLAIIVLLLTPFALIINVVATELFIYVLPQSEDNRHVGQWGVIVGTALVLIAALISRFEPAARGYLRRAKTQTKKSVRHHTKHLRDEDGDEESNNTGKRPGKLRRQSSYVPDKAILRDIWESITVGLYNTMISIGHWLTGPIWMIREEWRMFRLFWKNPLDWPLPLERPRPKKKSKKRSAQPKPILSASITSPQWHGYGSQETDHFDRKGFGTESHVHTVNEPLLAHNPSIGNHLSNRPGRSIALTKQPGVDRQVTISGSPPLGSSGNNSYNRKPVPMSAAGVSPLLGHPPSEISPYEVSPMQPQIAQFLTPDATYRPNRDSSRVMASLNDSILNRSRRSDVYLPAPGDEEDDEQEEEVLSEAHLSPRTVPPAITHQGAASIISAPETPHTTRSRSRSFTSTRSHDGLIPINIEPDTDSVPPLPPPKTNPNKNNHTDPHQPGGATILPPLPSRSSYLFSADELAQLYANGTPKIRSMLASRSSMANLVGNGGGNLSAGIHPGAVPDRVSYLQIQTRDTSAGASTATGTDQDWGDQVTLRRDREGRWVVVDTAAAAGRK